MPLKAWLCRQLYGHDIRLDSVVTSRNEQKVLTTRFLSRNGGTLGLKGEGELLVKSQSTTRDFAKYIVPRISYPSRIPGGFSQRMSEQTCRISFKVLTGMIYDVLLSMQSPIV